MSKRVLEKVAIVASVLIIGAGIWFWSTQVMSVIELLEMAG